MCSNLFCICSLSQVITGIQDLEFTVTDVVEGKEYLFRVTACNKCGPGEPAYIDEPINVSSPASESHRGKKMCQINILNKSSGSF